MSTFTAPAHLPTAVTQADTWLVWRYRQIEGEPKPRKVPFYISGKVRQGQQGAPDDVAALAPYERAVDVATRRNLSGIGLAMLPGNELVAVDFDDCVEPDGTVDPRVEAICEGTYSEYSPSGRGIRAFFTGSIGDNKDNTPKGDRFKVEFFHAKGFVTVTGRITPQAEMWMWHEAVPLTDAAKALHKERFNGHSHPTAIALSGDGGDDWFMTEAVAPDKVGLTLEKAKRLLDHIDPNCSRKEWVDILAALHYEFDGDDEALELAVEWSSRAEKFAGRDDVLGRWRSFKRTGGHVLNGSVLMRRSKDESAHEKYEAVAEWKEAIKTSEDEFELREKTCPKIAKDERLSDIERESLAQLLLTHLRSLGTKLTIAVCRSLIAPPKSRVPTVKQKRPLTEFGNAERMLDRYAESLMYVPENDAWYTWNGICWSRATETEIQHYAKETVRALVNEAGEHEADMSEFFEFCRNSQQAKMVRNMISLAASDPRVLVPASELDKHAGLLGVQNGVVDLKTGKLLESDPAYRITRCCSCDYVPDAKAPLFMKVLGDVFFDDKELVDFFLRVMGYTLIGQPDEDFMVIAYGNGSNGKSTLFGTVRKVMGSYAKSASAGSFVAGADGVGNAGGPREDLVRLQGARFVYVNEPDENGELREGAVKSMSGGDAITARTAYAKVSVEFEPTWVAFMPTNHKPIVKGSDNGIWRRLVMLPFLRNFDNDPKLEKDEKLAEKLQAESEGVLSLLVAAARAYMAHGLKPPAVVRKAREEYRSQMDILSEWLEERCEFDPTYSEKTQLLWQSWESFAKERGILQYVRSTVALGRRLDQRFPAARTNGSRLRNGLRLKLLEQPADDILDGFFE